MYLLGTREPLALWSNVELNVGMVCACLPSMRPLLKGISIGSFGSSHKSKGRPTVPISLSKASRTLQAHKSSFPTQYDGFTELREVPPQTGDGGRSSRGSIDELNKEVGEFKSPVVTAHMEV